MGEKNVCSKLIFFPWNDLHIHVVYNICRMFRDAFKDIFINDFSYPRSLHPRDRWVCCILNPPTAVEEMFFFFCEIMQSSPGRFLTLTEWLIFYSSIVKDGCVWVRCFACLLGFKMKDWTRTVHHEFACLK